MFLIAVLTYILCSYVAATNGERIIKTTNGPVRGRLQQYNNISYYSYEGIPYAENPTGSLRFRVNMYVTVYLITNTNNHIFFLFNLKFKFYCYQNATCFVCRFVCFKYNFLLHSPAPSPATAMDRCV